MRRDAAGIKKRGTRLAALSLAMVAMLAIAPPPSAEAQEAATIQSTILVLDPDRLFSGTEVGQKLTEDYQSERDALIANNRELEAELKAEEQALTDARDTMSAVQFRTEADAFDKKVRSIRLENEQKARDLERGRELAPLTLMRMAEPILVQIMRDTGGQIILDSRQVLLRADTIDITGLAIERVDAAIGDGANVDPDTGRPDIAPGAAATPQSNDPPQDESISNGQPRTGGERAAGEINTAPEAGLE